MMPQERRFKVKLPICRKCNEVDFQIGEPKAGKFCSKCGTQIVVVNMIEEITLNFRGSPLPE